MAIRTIAAIGADILRIWNRDYSGPKAPFFANCAREQIPALLALDTRDTAAMYGADTAADVLATFLGNVGPWRGAEARKLKAELREIVEGENYDL